MLLLRYLSRWPLRLLHALGSIVGWLSYGLSPSYRQRFVANARRAGISHACSRRAIAAAGQLVAELPFLWLRPATQPILHHVTWDGIALAEAAYDQGRGVVFLTPHLGCFEVTAQALAERFGANYGPITVLYRPARQRWLRELQADSRARPSLATAPATVAGVRKMIRALRRGEAVGLLPDQVPPDGMGVWAPFFGQPAYTMVLAARLVQQTGATPLLVWGERLARGRGYIVHVSTLPHALPAGDEAQAECATAINRAMETLIRQCPQQYLWGYDRYKSPRAVSGP
ncbi:MAG: lysophospholipid acyltransferase family protein [Burkholderiaceae bacterium]|nr:lysophospholipid acyltransferase family protein [Burkholderiaceae bacterium]